MSYSKQIYLPVSIMSNAAIELLEIQNQNELKEQYTTSGPGVK